MKILITGGAGFVGSRLALQFRAEHPKAEIVCFDNLKRRGSEINLAVFRQHNIEFCHGDIRSPGDLADLKGPFDLFVEASAEPSVLAGLDGAPDYLLQTNLVGTLNCLEYARQNAKSFIFLSTSRVYSIQPLRDIILEEGDTRFSVKAGQDKPGLSASGIGEDFCTTLPRSLYGATKLASELIIQEYADTYKLPAIINRCGVLAGPGQFGKVDQGVFTMWMARHYYKNNLKYIGFGGTGKQVRDIMHPTDLYSLVSKQWDQIDKHSGGIFNVGGGLEGSTSLLELTKTCETITGNSIDIAPVPETTSVDIPYYVTDNSRVEKAFDWKPKKNVEMVMSEIHKWLIENKEQLKTVFC
jgi:CDP-paratose 2-epimerase